MINPFDLCNTLLSLGSYSSLLQDYVIKPTTDSWLVKAKAGDYVATIKPTEFNTIEFTIPVSSLDNDSDEIISDVISSTEYMNGQLSIVSTSKGIILFYSTYLPISNMDLIELNSFGKLIVKEIRFVKEGLGLLRNKDEGLEPGALNADKFDSMMEDYNSKNNEESQ